MAPAAPPGSDPHDGGAGRDEDAGGAGGHGGGQHVVVLLHGHGDDAASLAPVAVALSDALGKITQTPQAPHRPATASDRADSGDIVQDGDGNGGGAWWPDDEDAPRRSTIDALLHEVLGTPPGPDGLRATIAGFSQGGAMALALAAALQRRHPAAHLQVIVVAGFLPAGDDVVPHDADVLVVHGSDDAVVDPFHGEMVARRCRRNGCRVTEISVAGGHVWDDAVTRALLAWLLRR